MAHLLHLFRRFDSSLNRVYFNEARRDIIQDKKDAIRDIREQTRDRLNGLQSEIQKELQEFKDQARIEYKVQRDDVKRKDLVEWIVRDALGQIRGDKARAFAREFIRKNLRPYEIKALAEGDTLKIERGRLSVMRDGKEIYAQDMMDWDRHGVMTQGRREAEARQTRAEPAPSAAPTAQPQTVQAEPTPAQEAQHLAIPVDAAPAPTASPVAAPASAAQPAPTESVSRPQPIPAEVAYLNGQESFHLPEDIDHWKGGDFDRNLKDMAYGEQILRDLNTLARIEGEGHGAIDLWQEMRKLNLNATNITVNEISRAVFKKPLDSVQYDMIDPRVPKERHEQIKLFLTTTKDLVRVFRAQDALQREKALQERVSTGLRLDAKAMPAWEALNRLFSPSDAGPNRRFHQDQEIGMNYVKGRADHELASPAAVNRYLSSILFKIDGNGTVTLRDAAQYKDQLAKILVQGAVVASKGEVHFDQSQALGIITSTDLPTLLGRHSEYLKAGVGAEFNAEMQKLNDQLLTANPISAALKEQLGLTSADLPKAEAAIREKLGLYAGQLVNMTDATQPWLEAWDAGIVIPVNGTPVQFKLGISGAGIMLTSDTDKKCVISWGANAGYGGLSTGVNMQAKLAEFKDGGSITFDTGAGVGVQIHGKEAGQFFGALIYATLGYNRDLGKVLESRTNASFDEVESDVRTALATVPGADAKAILETLKSEIGYDELKSMSALQFLGFKIGASVNTTRGPLAVMPVVALKFAILGKTYTVYQAQQPGVSASDLANAEFIGGIDADGESLFASNIQDRLTDGTETRYENGGVTLERVGETQNYKLKMPEAQGRINVYLDSKSGIAGTVDANGDIVFTLDASDKNITVRHAKALSTFGDSGFVENHDVYITANKAGETPADNETIWNRTGDKFVYYAMGVEKTRAASVKTHLSEEVRSETSERTEDRALIDARIAYEAAAKRLSEYNQTRPTQEVSADRKTAIDSVITTYLRNKEDRIDYKKLTVAVGPDQTAINTKIASIIGNSNEQEVAYARQKLMEATLHEISDSERARHIESWNTKRLQSKLNDTDGATSKSIIQELIQKGDASPIETQSKVLIEVGTEGIQGYRTAEYQEAGATLEHARDLKTLPVEIQKILKDQFLGIDAEAWMQNPLGQEVIRALGITEPELSESLTSKNPNEEAIRAFKAAYIALGENGSYTDAKGNTLKTPAGFTEVRIGFYDKCMNLAMVAEPVKLEVTIPEVENPTRTITFSTADVKTALKLQDRRDAVSLTNVTAVRTPETPTGGKNPGGEQETIEGGDRGAVEPHDSSNGGTETPGEGGGDIPV